MKRHAKTLTKDAIFRDDYERKTAAFPRNAFFDPKTAVRKFLPILLRIFFAGADLLRIMHQNHSINPQELYLKGMLNARI